MINLNNSYIAVTGASSMIGKTIIPMLKKRGARVYPIYRSDYNLIYPEQTHWALADSKAQYVIHLAGVNGNIKMNMERPETIFHQTSLINLNVIHSCIDLKVNKVVSVLASCAYPPLDVLTEQDLWKGDCHHTVFCHGHAKRILDIHAKAARKQFNLNAVNVIINNLMGPYDNFNEKGKVVSQFIRKYVHAKQKNIPEVVNWGTGIELREITYVKDAAEAIIQTLERYDEVTPLNISSDQEFTIKQIAQMVSKLVGYTGNTIWDNTKPTGQLRKKLDTHKMHQVLDINITPFDTALQETIDWYLANQEYADNKVIKW